MRIEARSILSLRAEHWEAWQAIRQTLPACASPQFAPEFLRLVAAVRPGIEVAILAEHGEFVGFLPFCRRRPGQAESPAGTMSNLYGLLARPSVAIDPVQLLRDCRLSRLQCRDLLARQSENLIPHAVRGCMPYMDLSHGFEAYRLARRAAGSEELKKTLQKERKACREIGPLRFEPCCQDPSVLGQLLEWKHAQLRERRLPNELTTTWQSALLRQAMALGTPHCAGMVSALFCGTELLAGSAGIRSHTVYNGWLTAYNSRFARYSPGLLLLVALARAANNLGMTRLDMGRGPEPYKQTFGSGHFEVVDGVIDAQPWRQELHMRWLNLREWARQQPFGAPARELVQRVRFVWSEWTGIA